VIRSRVNVSKNRNEVNCVPLSVVSVKFSSRLPLESPPSSVRLSLLLTNIKIYGMVARVISTPPRQSNPSLFL